MPVTIKRRTAAPAAKGEPDVYLARIHPYNPTQGFMARTYLIPDSGYPKFEEGRGWYEVDKDMARRLRRYRNNPDDQHSRPVFQVVTREQALAMDEAEREFVAEAQSPIRMPTARRPKREEPATEEVEPLAGWDDEDDEVPEAIDDGPLETADEDDLDEIAELERAAEAAADLTSAEVREGAAAPKKAASAKPAAANKPKPKAPAKKTATTKPRRSVGKS